MDADNQLAGLACKDPFFLGWSLAAFQERNGLDDAALAALLGCAPPVLVSLRLCRRPGAAAPPHTAEGDVLAIARRFGIDAAALGRVAGADSPWQRDDLPADCRP